MPPDTDRPTVRPWPLLIVFALAAFGASGALGALQSATGTDAELISLAQFGPAVGALLTWLIFRRRLRALLPAPVSRRQVRAHAVLMVVAVVLFACLAGVLVLATGHEPDGIAAVAGAPFMVYLALQLIGATGEELGWRGIMQPLLESRMGRFAAAVVTGLIWAGWHVQIFTASPGVIASFYVATVAFAILLGYLANGGFWQRALIAGLGHWLINISLNVLAGERVNESPQVYFSAVAAVVVAVLALWAFSKARKRRARVAGA